jgi:small subunit ribosomal protein S17
MEQNLAKDRNLRKERIGVVTSNKMTKTAVVTVEKHVTHPKYGKVIRRSTTYMAHDEKDEVSVGDRVLIVETRPLSRNKRWRILKVLERNQNT